MIKCRSIDSPMDPCCKLMAEQGESFSNNSTHCFQPCVSQDNTENDYHVREKVLSKEICTRFVGSNYQLP